MRILASFKLQEILTPGFSVIKGHPSAPIQPFTWVCVREWYERNRNNCSCSLPPQVPLSLHAHHHPTPQMNICALSVWPIFF